jgi:hypothetical protein
VFGFFLNISGNPKSFAAAAGNVDYIYELKVSPAASTTAATTATIHYHFFLPVADLSPSNNF